MTELCSWCQRRLAVRWTFWTQKPDGSGQEYLYCACDDCWKNLANDWYAKHEVNRDEWLVAKTQAT